MSVDEIDKDWQITAERYVVYIDIMGFKNMVAAQPPSAIYNMMKVINSSRDSSAKIGLVVAQEKMKFLIKSTTYSDSIMLYSRDSSPVSLNLILLATSRLVADLFEKRIPHKGAIACGVMTLDDENSIFFGQPLIDAYLLQEELHFYGVVMHHTAELKLTKETQMGLMVQYDCPLKNGGVNHKAVIPIFLHYHFQEQDPPKHQAVQDGLTSMYFMASGHLRKYYDNTKKYFEHIIEQTHRDHAIIKALKAQESDKKSG